MAVTIERQGDAIIAQVRGRVDGTNAAEFQDELIPVTDGSSQSVILDIGELSYISSAGLRVILLIARSLRAKESTFTICSPTESIREIFEISGFSQIIPIHNSQAEAVAALEG